MTFRAVAIFSNVDVQLSSETVTSTNKFYHEKACINISTSHTKKIQPFNI